MVFKEIENNPEIVRFGKSGNITIPISLVKKHWTQKGLLHVQVFHDEETKKIGLKPVKDKERCYKLYSAGGAWRITVRAFVRKIGVGEYLPKWNNKLEMLIIEYGKEGNN